MHVFYDDQVFQFQARGGISRYVCTLAEGLARNADATVTLFGGISRNDYLEWLPALPALRKIHWRRRDRLRINTQIQRISRLWRRVAFLVARRRARPIIYHPTYFVVDAFIARRADATIITFYDMIPEWLHEKSANRKPDRFLKCRCEAVQRADAILSISESTRRDLEHYFPGVSAKTFVTYLASHLGTETCDEPKMPSLGFSSFFLFVGNREQYKNGWLALQAMNRIKEQCPDAGMLFFGGKSFSDEEREYISDHRLDRHIQQFRGADNVLAACYRKAVALVYPTEYEGFGLPVVEAMQCECPVITVNSSSLPEVGGDAAIYIDPKKPESLVEAMSALFTNPAMRRELILKGNFQSSKFSWARTVEETKQVYRSVLKRERGHP